MLDRPHSIHRAAPIAAAAKSASVSIELVEPAAAEALAEEWAALAADAVETNPFFSPFMLIPALRHLDAQGVKVLTVRDGRGLAALLPVERASGHARLPVPHWRTWIYRHCFFGAPLVRRGAMEAFLEGLEAFADSRAPYAGFVRLRSLDVDGPVATALTPLRRRVVYASGVYERAVLRGGFEATAYISGNIRKKKMKEVRRRARRLADLGEVRYRELRGGEELTTWAEEFLRLEHQSWKRDQMSSLRANPADERFFHEVVENARISGDLQFIRLDAGDSPVSMMVNFERNGETYGFKIAFDEAFARFSPGVMIEIEFLQRYEGRARDHFVDSCASADHPMIDSLWHERRRIGGLNISSRRAASRAVMSLCRFLETARENQARRGAKPA